MTMSPAERHTTEADEAAKTAWITKHEAGRAAEAAHRAANPTARDHALAIADELVALMAGELYLDEDGGFTTTAPSKCNREPAGIYCFECEDNAEPGHDVEPATLFDWLETCLDVELYSRNGELHHVDVLVCYGGPTCWLEGKRGNVVYGHGWDTAEVFVDGLAEALVDACEGLA